MQGNANCTAFQLSPDRGKCQMFDYAELPSHPYFHDSDSTASEICGLCAKGPNGRKIYESDGFYCFTTGRGSFIAMYISCIA